MTLHLQRQYDAIKARLAEEEAALARQRDSLPASELQTRAADFDRRYRQARRVAAEKAAEVQSAFQEARADLVRVLPEIISTLRIDVGAVAILDADQALAIDPDRDLTDRAIALLNARIPSPALPRLDLRLPVPQEAGEEVDTGEEAAGATSSEPTAPAQDVEQ
ncbi:MAG: OmpH family outer membrane protein [Pseudomonadota bacterium]